MNIERIQTRAPSISAELQRADYQRQKETLMQRVSVGDIQCGQKRCFKCYRVKPLADFYLHPQMADGHLNKCKDCTKRDAADRLQEKREYVREYDAWRQRLPSRRKKKQDYHKTHNSRFPEKAAARTAVANAVRDGKLKRLPCEVCGKPETQAHHTDYSKALDVQWLCFKHHREIGHGQKVG